MEHITQYITQGLTELGLLNQVPATAPQVLDRYCSLLLEQNKHMNLTAITTPREAASLHMLDSAALLTCPGVDFVGKNLLDVGTGAGLPGLPLKILVPTLTVTLLDSLQKRTDWLTSTAAALSLSNIHILCARAEEAAHTPSLREQFDLVTARAVANLRLLCELCLPFVKVGGHFLAMKGPDWPDEAAEAEGALAQLGGQVVRTYTYTVSLNGAEHSVVVIEKNNPTPEKFPRRWSRIRKAPL